MVEIAQSGPLIALKQQGWRFLCFAFRSNIPVSLIPNALLDIIEALDGSGGYVPAAGVYYVVYSPARADVLRGTLAALRLDGIVENVRDM